MSLLTEANFYEVCLEPRNILNLTSFVFAFLRVFVPSW